jgi:hypothetical protein
MSEYDERPDDADIVDEILSADEAADLPDDAPEADAYEQRLDVLERGDQFPSELPDDANPADVLEQELVVDDEEDDYR